MDILPIDQMPHLAKRLGKVGCDRIRFAQMGRNRKQAGATNIQNRVIHNMQLRKPSDQGCPIADVITGAAQSVDANSKPLNVNRIYNILQCMEIVNSKEVQTMMGIGDRQARRYVRAVKQVMPFLERTFNKDSLNDRIIPI